MGDFTIIPIAVLPKEKLVQCEECGYPLIGPNTRDAHAHVLKEHGEHLRPGAPRDCLACQVLAFRALIEDSLALSPQPPH